MSTRIAVVGAGVMGLSVAHELASAGNQVSVVADLETPDTVSAIAAALWFPFKSERSPQVDVLLARSLARFEALSKDASTGVAQRSGTVVERSATPNRSWARNLHGVTSVDPGDLPPGAASGLRVTVPFINVPTYLPWLRKQAAARGVTFTHQAVGAVSELRTSAEVVVVAAGIRSAQLLGDDDSVYPVRGQIVRLANPNLQEWITDEDNPAGLTYVFPRGEDVIVGGVADQGSWLTTIDPVVEEEILHRARALVPALEGQAVLGRAAGLRPARPTLRLAQVEGAGFPVVAAYGHGGAGVTLSWGTAEKVRELIDELV